MEKRGHRGLERGGGGSQWSLGCGSSEIPRVHIVSSRTRGEGASLICWAEILLSGGVFVCRSLQDLSFSLYSSADLKWAVGADSLLGG